MRKTLILGNWKMNGSQGLLEEMLPALAGETFAADVGICPPTGFIAQASALVRETAVVIGAQNASQHESGAYTGEISVAMLKELGSQYVLVGHSERRQYYGETDAIVAEKFAAILQGGLIPVLCIGETQEEHDRGETEQVVFRQVDAVLDLVGSDAFENAVIAYEPVWAIGTGKTATPEQAQSVHHLIRQHVAAVNAAQAESVQILYGGSMKAANAGELLDQPDIDGGLVGGASLKTDEFIALCSAAG